MSVILVAQELLDEQLHDQRHQMKKGEMGEACRTYWDKRNAYRLWFINLNNITAWKT